MKSLCFLALLSIILCSPIFLNEKWTSDFLSIDGTNKLFYILFKSRANLSKAPLVFWLQGGPGCSGLKNALTENGPFAINSDLTLTSSFYSWNNNADVVYIDQPLGTGFSSVKDISRIPSTRKQLIEDFRNFLKAFLEKHTEYHGRDFYLAGHSYGTRFVLMYAKDLIDRKYDQLNLKGIALGNGWYKPNTMLKSFTDFAEENKLFINSFSYITTRLAYFFSSLFTNLRLHTLAHFFDQLGQIALNGINKRINLYDIRKECNPKPSCYDASKLIAFMNRSDVLHELKVDKKIWVQCSKNVYNQLVANEMYTDITNVLEELLNKIKVVIYNGKYDWRCNIKGIYATINQLKWNKKKEFDLSSWKPWIVTGRLAGKYKEAGKFKLYEVYDAGHLVTFDQPESSFDILTELLNE